MKKNGLIFILKILKKKKEVLNESEKNVLGWDNKYKRSGVVIK